MSAKTSVMKRKSAAVPESGSELTKLAEEACLVAKDAAYNLRDYMENSSNMALMAVSDCEKELDRMERRIDQEIPAAITQVNEAEARQLLACLKFIIDLERIGDLTWSVAKHMQALTTKLLREDLKDLSQMAAVLEKMLVTIHEGFLHRDLDSAAWVMSTDSQLDQFCRSLFRRHLESRDRRPREYSTTTLLMAQAFERAGDHAKNLAEELVHLVEGRSMRHEPKRKAPA